MTLREAAKKMADCLTRDYPAKEVWLIGSAARSEARAGSDIDLLAVVEDSSLPSYQRAQRAHRLLGETTYPKDVIVLTRNEWARQRNVVNTLPYIAEKEGLLLSRHDT